VWEFDAYYEPYFTICIFFFFLLFWEHLFVDETIHVLILNIPCNPSRRPTFKTQLLIIRSVVLPPGVNPIEINKYINKDAFVNLSADSVTARTR